MRSSTVTRRNLTLKPTTFISNKFIRSCNSQDDDDGSETTTSTPSTSPTEYNKSAQHFFSSRQHAGSMKPLLASRQQQQKTCCTISSSNSKTRRRKHSSNYGLWWCWRLIRQWTLQYSVVTQCLFLILFHCIILCLIYFVPKVHWHRSLFLLPCLPTAFHSYHFLHHQQHPSHLHIHQEHFPSATTTIDTRNRGNTRSIHSAPASPISTTLYTYPKSLYLHYDYNQGRRRGYSSMAPTKPIHDTALDWYNDDKYGYHYTEPDFGGLDIRMLVVDDDIVLKHNEKVSSSSSSNYPYHQDHYSHNHVGGLRRPIYYNDRYYIDWHHSDDDAMRVGATNDEYNYYAFDDDAKRDPWRQYHHPMIEGQTDENNKTCRRVSWHREMQSNCLNFHEFDFVNHVLQGSSKYIGGGAFRSVFQVGGDDEIYDNHGGTANSIIDPTVATMDRFVLKECSMGEERHLGHEDMESMRMDGAVGAALQPHPLFVDIYGFCALSMFSELMEHGDHMESISVPSYHRPSCDDDEEFYLLDEDDVEPWNDLTPTAKLEYALLMAEAVAVLNNFEHGVIVHDDLQPAQFLPTKDGLKFNDFNRAEIMLYDEDNQQYCQYRNGEGFGDWRAPEEYRLDAYLDEKIDVFSLGNNFYSLLTGLFVFYEECDEVNVQRRVVDGEWPYIDERWLNHSFAEARLVEIMQQCWTYEAEDRIDIGTLVQLLRNAVQENRQYGEDQDAAAAAAAAAKEVHHHQHSNRRRHGHGQEESYHHNAHSVQNRTQQQQQQ